MTLEDISGPPTAGSLVSGGLREAARYLDKKAYWRVPNKVAGSDGLEVEVVIQDIRLHFGTLDFLVTPVAGRGPGRWVRADYLTLVES